LSPTTYWKEKLGADVFSTLQGREAVITCCATITDFAMANREKELSADVFSTLQGREAIIMGQAAVTDFAMANREKELGADVFSTLQGREAIIMGRAAVTYSTKATCLTQIMRREQVKVSLPLTLAKVSWIKILSWWAHFPAPTHAIVAVAVILIPVLAGSTLAWTGLACDFEVITGSFCTVESFCVCIEFIKLFLSQAGTPIDWVLN